MALPQHSPLKKFFRDASRRMEVARVRGEVADFEDQLHVFLTEPGKIDGRAFLELNWLGHLFGVAAVEAYGQGDAQTLSDALARCIACKTLGLRLEQALSASYPDTPDERPKEFEHGLSAASALVVMDWPLAQTCAEAFLWLAEKDQRLRTPESRRLTNGTTDAFLIRLFSDVWDLPTRFQSLDPLEDCYAQLLTQWRTADQGAFEAVMKDATEFHIRRSKPSTDHTTFEFDHLFEQVFPTELLAIMSLRKRLNLPTFPAGHALVDAPWEVMRALPQPVPYPLTAQLETRFKQDYPTFA